MKPYDTSGMLDNDDELERVLRDYFQQEMPPELLETPDISDEEYENRFKELNKFKVTVPVESTQRKFKLSHLAVGICACLILALIVFTQFQPAGNVPVANNTISQPKLVPPAESDSVIRDSNMMESESLMVVDHGSVSQEMPHKVAKAVEESIDITLFNTERGPIEQRTEISWTNITVQHPETGMNVEMSMPELTIDFIPVNKAGLSLIKEEKTDHQR